MAGRGKRLVYAQTLGSEAEDNVFSEAGQDVDARRGTGDEPVRPDLTLSTEELRPVGEAEGDDRSGLSHEGEATPRADEDAVVSGEEHFGDWNSSDDEMLEDLIREERRQLDAADEGDEDEIIYSEEKGEEEVEEGRASRGRTGCCCQWSRAPHQSPKR